MVPKQRRIDILKISECYFKIIGWNLIAELPYLQKISKLTLKEENAQFVRRNDFSKYPYSRECSSGNCRVSAQDK